MLAAVGSIHSQHQNKLVTDVPLWAVQPGYDFLSCAYSNLNFNSINNHSNSNSNSTNNTNHAHDIGPYNLGALRVWVPPWGGGDPYQLFDAKQDNLKTKRSPKPLNLNRSLKAERTPMKRGYMRNGSFPK